MLNSAASMVDSMVELWDVSVLNLVVPTAGMMAGMWAEMVLSLAD